MTPPDPDESLARPRDGSNRSHGFKASLALFDRARAVIPGGIYGHVTPALLEPGASPYYAARAQGCRYWDVDGNEFLDFMCGYGPVVLGHGHPEVEAAVDRARRDGVCFNHPTAYMVELAERLTNLVDFAGWAVFAKNGSDVTTWCTQVAREATGRRQLLLAEGAYHGSAPWCTPGHGGLIEEDQAAIDHFRWNDPQSLEDAFRRCAGDVAAVVLTPFHHPLFDGSFLPDQDFVSAVNQACKDHGALLIMDDIRAGFRLHIGGSHRVFGFEPDLACYSKAMANGYPISAAVGKENLKVAASKVFLTGSFWNSPVEMAAALATLEVLERDGTIEHMREQGVALRQGLEAAAARHGFGVRVSGPPQIPFMAFEDDADYALRRAFTRRIFEQGVFLHPHHNWFLCGAHTAHDIGECVTAVDAALADLARSETKTGPQPTATSGG